MEALHLVCYFFGGGFLANAVPHFVAGIMGEAFQTPFAKPHGEGLSSSTVNVLWAFVNLALSYALVAQVGNFDPRSLAHILALGAGALALALFSARHFGRFHGGNSPGGA